MLRKVKLGIASIFMIWMLVSMTFGGAAEDWVIKESLDVAVTSIETEIMESTLTDKKFNRKFEIYNGESEIFVTAWGSNDEVNWEVMDTQTISANNCEWVILGHNHFWYIKLTGKTTLSPEAISIVDTYFYYRAP